MDLFKPVSENKAARLAFYIFEFASLAIFALGFIICIVEAVNYSSFLWFVESLISVCVNTLIVYALGRLVDLGYAKVCKCNEKKTEEKKEPETKKD